MSASDAIPVPRKNTAFRLTFPVYDTAGALKSSLASADSEISLDGAAFADCTNEVTEIGSTGFYYIDFTSGEMNADTVAYKLSGTGINPLTAVLYPEEAGDYRGSVTSIAAGAITAAAIDTGAIDADALAADAVTEIQSGLATAAALATVDTVVDSILVDTAEIGVAGAGLTAVPWNASWDAQVESEVTDALNAYDPPTKAELDSAVSPLATSSALSTVAGYLDTEIAAILADTNELQADWANGGRLDLILDARASQSSVDTIDGIVDSILVDTTEIGAAGAGLTALASAANLATVDSTVDAILVDTDTTIPGLIAALNDLAASDILTTALTESYAADGAAPTLTQALYLIQQFLYERATSGTTVTVKKLDGSTTAATLTLNDGTSPTSITRAS